MASLPFAVAPRQHPPRRVGTLDSGILEIPVLGGLTVEESATISELLANDVNVFVLAAQLSDAIAKQSDISQPEAFAIVEQVMAGVRLKGKAEEIRLAFAERLEALARHYANSGQRNIEASVTAIIRHRIGPTDWSIPAGFPRVLLMDIWQLVVDEQAAENLPTNRPTDEELGKLQPASGKRRGRTGPASSGASATPSPVPSPETPSAVS